MALVAGAWLVIGYLAARCFAPKAALPERIAFSLLFAVSIVPYFVVAYAFLAPGFVTDGTLISATILVLIFFGVLAWRRRGEWSRFTAVTRWDAAAVVLAVPVGVAAWFHYNDSEFLLALASYLQRGEAECFYMQTFKLVGALHPGGLRSSYKEAYDIISTPGNVVFTSAFIPLFGRHAFHILYVVFQVLVFWFAYLLANAWTEKPAAALAAALFAVGNPYLLWVEVLDRNVISFSLGSALLYAVWTRDNRPLFLGFLYGVCAGTGLRFLWLVGAFPVALIFFVRKRSWKTYAGFAFAGLATFAFNLPHLAWHGFHALGETQPAWNLALNALLHPARTPLVPYPNVAYYGFQTLRLLGVAACALMLVGIFEIKKRCTLRFTIPFLIFLPVVAVLAAQRDWIESDKLRILLAAFPAFVVWFAAGVSSLIKVERPLRSIAIIVICAAIAINLAVVVSKWDARADTTSEDRKPVYQSESATFMTFYRQAFSEFAIWPRYAPLFDKLRWSRKRIESRIVERTLFGAGGDPRVVKHPWVEAHLGDSNSTPEPKVDFSGRFARLTIDIEKLVTDPINAVTAAADDAEFFVDFIEEQNVLDIYHKAVAVSWQPEPLTVTVLTGKPEYRSLAELPIEIDAFMSYGKDDVGFERVNFVHLRTPDRRKAAFETGLTALPQTDDQPKISVRIPVEVRMILRYWVVDTAKGAPHRIDAWEIRADGDTPQVRFFPLEPESYL